MSHLLASVNKEASDAIQPDPPAQAVPDVGHIVIYHMQQGYARQGRTRFPALVQGANDRGQLSLLVLIDGSDFIDEQFVEQIGPGREFRCWEWPDDSRNANGFRGTIAALHQRIGDLEDNVADLRAIILGDYDVPKVALFEIFAKLEARLKAVESGSKKK